MGNVEELGLTEVTDLDLPAGSEQNVGRFEIPVHDPCRWCPEVHDQE